MHWFFDDLEPGDLITGLSIVVSTSVAIFIWWRQRRADEIRQRKELTLELCNPQKLNPQTWPNVGLVIGPPGDYARPKFVRFLDGKGLNSDAMTDVDWKTYNAIQDVLTHLEFIAVSVLSGATHEEFIKSWYGETVHQVHDRLEEWITEVRRRDDNEDAYAAFSKLVERWKQAGWNVPKW
jgi:hypothetical protein